MSQQINLLQRKAKPRTQGLGALAAIIVILGVIVVYASSASKRTQELNRQAVASETRVAQLRNTVQAAQKAAETQDSAAAIDAELAILRPRARGASDLVTTIRNGNLGNSQGFSRYFGVLSTAASADVWVTDVTIGRGGKEMTVLGRADHNESAFRYARRLNEVYAPYGIVFRSIELKPELPPQGNGPVLVAPPSSVAFKLS